MDTLTTLSSYISAQPQFGSGAGYLTIFPATSSGGLANFADGIPSNYDITHTTGGSPGAKRVILGDINGIGALATKDQYFLQCGGFYTFDQTVSAYIGGYPSGIQLGYFDNTYYRRVISLIDNNTYDFVTTPSYIDNIHWAYCDDSSINQSNIFFDYNNASTTQWWNGTWSNRQYTFTAPYDCNFIWQLSFLTAPNDPYPYSMKVYLQYGVTKKLISSYSTTTGAYKMQLMKRVTIRKGTVVIVELTGPCQSTEGKYTISKLTTGDWT